MLVGILSMQRIVNYGSFMQAYSLKKMVESLGHKVVFVDYKTNVLIEDRNDKTKRVRRIRCTLFVLFSRIQFLNQYFTGFEFY